MFHVCSQTSVRLWNYRKRFQRLLIGDWTLLWKTNGGIYITMLTPASHITYPHWNIWLYDHVLFGWQDCQRSIHVCLFISLRLHTYKLPTKYRALVSAMSCFSSACRSQPSIAYELRQCTLHTLSVMAVTSRWLANTTQKPWLARLSNCWSCCQQRMWCGRSSTSSV